LWGVLVAISIPIFTSQLEKSRDAVSIANIRAAYAEASSAYLTESDGGNAKVNLTAKTATVSGVVLKGTQSGWSNLDSQLPFTHTSMTDAIGGTAGTYELVFTFTDDGGCTLTSLTAKNS
jgi:hypothetical protein